MTPEAATLLATGGGSSKMHALIFGRGEALWTPEGHQAHGFEMNRSDLARRLDLTFEMIAPCTLTEVEETVIHRPADVAFVMISWREDPSEVTALFRRLEAWPGRPSLVFVDHHAPASSPYLGVLPHVDCYAKRQMYRDPSLYLEEFAGGNALTDHVANSLGIALDGWDFSSRPDPDHLHKMVPGWNLGVTPRYRQLLGLTAAMPLPWEWRPFAVNCRIGLAGDQEKSDEWYHRYRARWGEALDPLRDEFSCTGTGRVGRRRYFAEMVMSRIGVSPFGWGEVCFRDYEIVAAGALLVKPSMTHLKTSPDIFVDGKTYVAASWNPDDVRDVCRYYLAHPEQAREIIHQGRAALAAYFENGGFVEDIRRILGVAAASRRQKPAAIGRVPIPA